MPEYHLDCSLAKETRHALDPFTLAYIEAAMWTLTDDDGASLDYLGLHDLAPETIAQATEDCRRFQATYRADLEATDGEEAQHGHDFWLTRNRHGAGFWDREYGAVGDRLTNAAHAEGEVEWYVGEDGMVYQS